MTAPRAAAGTARRLGLLAALLCVAVTTLLGPGAGSAAAHPLNNFSINQHHSLDLYPDRIVDRVVVDSAEIPTLQQKVDVDTDGDEQYAPAERAAYAARECATVAGAVRGSVDGAALRWSLQRSSLEYLPGEGGLQVARLECDLLAPAALDGPADVRFATEYRSGNVGWREITATGHGVRMTAASVAERSISEELRRYPDDLLASPLDQRSATLTTVPGDGASPGLAPRVDSAGPLASVLAPVQDTFDDLVGRDLTVGVGLAAMALAMLLGASHAALPGHGKTVMAAYLVGRHGGVRDALIVGGTVTATHTGGVLAMGLLLSATAAVSGEGLLAWLGLASGALIAGIGVMLLRSAWRHRGEPGHGHGHSHGHGHGHSHGHGHGHSHGHGNGRHHGDGGPATPVPALALAGGGTAAITAAVPSSAAPRVDDRPEDTHGHGHGHAGTGTGTGFTRRGLVGLGVAGGLVPSPSALIVLLGAIALGRTWFGVGLVLGYGLGMAVTLMAAGLLLVKLRDRVGGLLAGRRAGPLARVSAAMPILTALLVVAVGVGLMLNELSRI